MSCQARLLAIQVSTSQAELAHSLVVAYNWASSTTYSAVMEITCTCSLWGLPRGQHTFDITCGAKTCNATTKPGALLRLRHASHVHHGSRGTSWLPSFRNKVLEMHKIEQLQPISGIHGLRYIRNVATSIFSVWVILQIFWPKKLTDGKNNWLCAKCATHRVASFPGHS